MSGWPVTLALAVAIATIPAQQRPTFRTSTRLIEVSVVVTGSDGRAVKGLTQADFVLEEDGKVQPISFFEVHDEGTPPPERGTSLFDVRGGPNLFTNVTPATGGVTTVLLFDKLNAAFDSQYQARRHIDTYLESMRPGDRVALYALDGSIRVLHDFTSDADSLRRAIEIYQARVHSDYDASNEPPAETDGMAVWLVDPATNVADFFQRKRATNTLDLLQILAEHLGGISGRKNLVWVSEAFSIPTNLDRLEVTEKLRKANRALSDAQVSVYPVDSRGLVGAHRLGAGGQVMFHTLASVRGNIETMEIVAEETGGRVFANTNALSQSITRATDDARTMYVLGYYPASSTDGSFRRIDVKVNRARVRVRHRSGYRATPPPSRDTGARDKAIKAALEAPLQSTGVGLAAETSTSDEGLTVGLRIDPATLTLERQGTLWRGAVDVLVAQVDASGRGTVDVSVPLTFSLTDEERTQALTRGIEVRHTIALKPRTIQIRIVARDVATGKVGSLVIPSRR